MSTLFARRLEPADTVGATALLETACVDHPVLDYCCAGAAAQGKRLWLLE